MSGLFRFILTSAIRLRFVALILFPWFICGLLAVPGVRGEPAAKAQKSRCKTFAEGMVFFGEESSRSSAVKKLDEAISSWRKLTGNTGAKEIKRTVDCKIAISLLNEYECTAEATLCK